MFRWRRPCPPLNLRCAADGRAMPGISNYNGWQTAKAAAVAGFPLVANQSEYSLLRRKPEAELIPAIEDAGLGLWRGRRWAAASSPANTAGMCPPIRGRPARGWPRYVEPYLERPCVAGGGGCGHGGAGAGPVLAGCCAELAAVPAGVATAIVGARTPVQLKEILDAAAHAAAGGNRAGPGGRLQRPGLEARVRDGPGSKPSQVSLRRFPDPRRRRLRPRLRLPRHRTPRSGVTSP